MTHQPRINNFRKQKTLREICNIRSKEPQYPAQLHPFVKNFGVSTYRVIIDFLYSKWRTLFGYEGMSLAQNSRPFVVISIITYQHYYFAFNSKTNKQNSRWLRTSQFTHVHLSTVCTMTNK